MAPKSISAGVDYRGNGYRIRIYGKGGKVVHQETLESPPTQAGEKEAIKRRQYLLSRKRLGLSLKDGDGGQETLGEVADRWYKSLQLDEDTENKYWGILNQHWFPLFEHHPINEITQDAIIEYLGESGLAPKTQKNITGPLRMVLQHGRATPNPAIGIKWPKRKGDKRKKDRYTPEQRKALMDRLDKMAHASQALAQEKPTQLNRSRAHWRRQASVYFPLLFGTGLRPGEALGLLSRDYDGEFLNIDKQYTRGKAKDSTKTGDDRKVLVPSWLRPRLDDFLRFRESGPVFQGFQGGALKDTKRLNPVWEKAHDKEKIRLRDPYVCRHTKASELLSRGVIPAAAAAYLGHTPETFLSEYATFVEEFCDLRDWSQFDTPLETTVQEPSTKTG